MEKVVEELAPDKPLKSISMVANDPPSVNSYNTFLVGSSSISASLPPTIGINSHKSFI